MKLQRTRLAARSLELDARSHSIVEENAIRPARRARWSEFQAEDPEIGRPLAHGHFY